VAHKSRPAKAGLSPRLRARKSQSVKSRSEKSLRSMPLSTSARDIHGNFPIAASANAAQEICAAAVSPY